MIEPAPAATQGYDDLRRDAAAIHLGEDLDVTVTSLVDLVRIAEGSGEPPDGPFDPSGSSRCSPTTKSTAW